MDDISSILFESLIPAAVDSLTDDSQDPALGIVDDITGLAGGLLEDPESLDGDSVLGLIGDSLGESVIYPAVSEITGDVVSDIATDALSDQLGVFAQIAGE
ncbi:MAG: hypothetical protein MJK14_02975, partial [Rivularia sp. ALOHA_DT_140]|nr:hypothetical protein [Rivularia sp. ALOHA_DT_140]